MRRRVRRQPRRRGGPAALLADAGVGLADAEDVLEPGFFLHRLSQLEALLLLDRFLELLFEPLPVVVVILGFLLYIT